VGSPDMSTSGVATSPSIPIGPLSWDVLVLAPARLVEVKYRRELELLICRSFPGCPTTTGRILIVVARFLVA
jgi:hypothetical protein